MPLVTLLGGEPKSIPTYGSLKMMSPDRAIGGERKLMVDYNQSLSVVEATRRVRVLDEGGLFWIAEAAGLPVSSHIFPEFSVHLLGVTPTGPWLEYLDTGSTILREPVRIQDGHAVIPDRPSSGLEWNEEAVKPWLAQ